MASPIQTSNQGAELPAGSRVWRLIEIQEGTQPEKKVSQGSDGKKIFTPTGRDVPALHFRFSTMHPTLGEAKTRKTVAPFNGPSSGFVKLLNAMAPGVLSEETRKDSEKIWTFARSFIGRDFIVSTEPKGGYNNFKNITPMPEGMAQKATAPAPAAPAAAVVVPPPHILPDGTVAFSDDDIPF